MQFVTASGTFAHGTPSSVDEELLLRNEYLVTENQMLRNQLKGRLQLTDGERRSLAELGKKLGKKALEDVMVSRRAAIIFASSNDSGSDMEVLETSERFPPN